MLVVARGSAVPCPDTQHTQRQRGRNKTEELLIELYSSFPKKKKSDAAAELVVNIRAYLRSPLHPASINPRKKNCRRPLSLPKC